MRGVLLLVGAWSLCVQAQTVTAASGLKVAPLPMSGVGAPLSGVTDFRFLPDGRMVITEKGGYSNTANTSVNARVLIRALDGSLKVAGTFPVNTYTEQGLLGVEVDPAFTSTRRLFFYYSRATSAGGTDDNRHRVVSVVLKPDDTFDNATETILVQNILGPIIHDGGGLAIGADGKLYISTGDSGCNSGTCCPANNLYSSCLSNANGKILRINLDGSIPTDNPLYGVVTATACGSFCSVPYTAANQAAPRTEIWAWGFRNPFRIWVDPVTGNLWAGDVGEASREELDVVRKGKHYGYPWREGTNVCPQSGACSPDAGICDVYTPGSGSCVEPVWECRHPQCASVTQGTIVDSCSWPATLRGNLFFGDSTTGAVWMVRVNASRDAVVEGSSTDAGVGTFGVPVSFRVGPDGDLYVADYQFASILKVSPVSPVACPPDAGSGGGGGSGSGGGAGGGGGSAGGGGGSGSGGGAGGGGGSAGGGGAGGGAAGGGAAGGGAAGGGSAGGGAAGGGSAGGGAAGGGSAGGGAAGGGSAGGGAAGGGAAGGGAAGGGSAGGGAAGGGSAGGGSAGGGAAGGGAAGGGSAGGGSAGGGSAGGGSAGGGSAGGGSAGGGSAGGGSAGGGSAGGGSAGGGSAGGGSAGGGSAGGGSAGGGAAGGGSAGGGSAGGGSAGGGAAGGGAGGGAGETTASGCGCQSGGVEAFLAGLLGLVLRRRRRTAG